MAKEKPPQHLIGAKQILKALLTESSNERKILELAACNKLRLISNGNEWNKVLMFLVKNFKDENGKPKLAGNRLGNLKKNLPIEFR